MPELPEAEVTATQLRDTIIGARVRRCWIGRRDIVREGLATLPWYENTCVQSVERRGKTVVIAFNRDSETRFIAAELGMTGLLLFPATPVRHPQHIHFVMHLEGARQSEIRYWNPRRFGRLYLLDAAGLAEYSSRRFGHDPLAMSCEQFFDVVAASRGRLKTLLMQQKKIAGIGNIYANEILFRTGLHPDKIGCRLRRSDIERLYKTMQDVLREGIQNGGSSVRDFFAPDGTSGTYRLQHQVYGKDGEPCPNRCGGLLRKLIHERTSFYCPLCQPKSYSPRRLLTSYSRVP
jgi:formamidopyrimidine-DNA glycosylase